MSFYDKAKWTLGILMIFMLVLSTNLIDRNNFNQVKNSVESIYEDRLIAKDILYDLLKIVHRKELAIIAGDQEFLERLNTTLNNDIEGLFTLYGQTKLTTKEQYLFEKLNANFEVLSKLEQKKKFTEDNAHEISKSVTAIKNNIEELSIIQLTEGKREMSIGKHALDTVELFTQIEIYILIFLAIVAQVVILYPNSLKKNTSEREDSYSLDSI